MIIPGVWRNPEIDLPITPKQRHSKQRPCQRGMIVPASKPAGLPHLKASYHVYRLVKSERLRADKP
jgi:hypothetical protein